MSDASGVLVVDSSVAVKWFLSEREDHVDIALALLTAHLDEHVRLAAPEHLRLEVLNALLHRGLGADALERAAAALDGFRLDWHRIGPEVARSAALTAAAAGLTVYDSAFAALALELDAELITADRHLTAAQVCRVRLLGT
jgi:predicted nucleic acid-binding protein